MIDAGVIRKLGELDSGGGRPREVLSLETQAGAFVAIDLEGVTVRFARTNLTGEIVRRCEVLVPFGKSLPLDALFDGIDTVLQDLPPNGRDTVLAIGVSFPGVLDRNGLLTAVNLGWRDVPLEGLLRYRYQLPVFL